MDGLTPLEQSVLHAFLRGDHPVLESLRDQLPGLVVVRRSVSASAFRTVLRPTASSPVASVPDGRAVLDDLYAEIPGLSAAASFALFVEEGRLARLEGSTFGGEQWPDDLAGFTLHHDDPERDLSALGPGYCEPDPNAP